MSEASESAISVKRSESAPSLCETFEGDEEELEEDDDVSGECLTVLCALQH